MGFFTPNFNKAGRGVSKDEPRKKGFRRFIEIITRDFRDLMKVNLLFFLCILPSAALFSWGLLGNLVIVLILSVIAAYPVGGAVTASFFCITRMLRDDPGFLWDDFKRKFLENHRLAGAAGILTAAFVYTQIFLFWLPILADWEVADTAWIIAALLLFILFFMFAPYVFLQFAYINLGTFTIIKNSTLLALSNLGRSLMGLICGLIPWVVMTLFFPITLVFLPIVPFFFFVLSWLLSLMWVWPVFDKHFSVEETLTKERDIQDF